ncbi:MAG: TldD/PmbA family protein [Bacteroidales bacterium]|jgi:PmbA protein|nr:TldD/PmbA family protein [Bacteroidales bacterium]
MKNEKQMTFPELSQWVIDRTLKAGASDCRVSISKRRFIEIIYRERKPDTLKEATTRSLNLEVYVGSKYANQSTPDIRMSSLEKFIADLTESARIMEEDPFRSLPDPEYYAGRSEADLVKIDPSYDQLSPEERHSIVRKAEDACLEEGGEKVISVEAGEYDEKYEEYIRTSNGFEGSSGGTAFQMGASMYGQDEGDRRPNGYNYSVATHLSDLSAPELVGREAARRTFGLFGAKKMKTARLPVIVENRVVEVLLGFLNGPLTGRSIQQKRSCFADRKGQKIGSKLLTLTDDPFIPRGLGSRLYDRDGFPARKRDLITEGVLNDFLIDWYYSRKLECEPTSGTYSNIVIPPGERSVENIIKDLPDCLLITDFLGGNSNTTTGDFSIGIFGKLYRKGQFLQNIAEMNIADNQLNFWNKLIEVANDPWLNSAVRVPSLVFENVVVSGI